MDFNILFFFFFLAVGTISNYVSVPLMDKCRENSCLHYKLTVGLQQTPPVKIHYFYPLNTVIIPTTLNKLSLTQPSIPL